MIRHGYAVRCAGIVCFGIALNLAPQVAPAGVIVQPVGASSDTSTVFGDVSHLRDQSGLSTGYTSLVTDFDAYIASNPTHNSSSLNNIWAGSRPDLGGSVDFNLGGAYTIESMALWNLGGNNPSNILSGTLLADDNPNFSSPVVLTSFNANPNTGPAGAVLPQVIAFAPTTASWVRLDNISALDQSGGFGEAAFEVVPEPASLVSLCTVTSAVLLGRRRRR